MNIKLNLVRNFLIALSSVLLCFLFVKFISNINLPAVDYGMAMKVSQFANSNNHRLPKTWEEFSEWCKTQGDSNWDPKSLNEEFRLEWGMDLRVLKEGKVIIHVLDPKLKMNLRANQ